LTWEEGNLFGEGMEFTRTLQSGEVIDLGIVEANE